MLEGEGCFEPDQVARLSDTYINCHIGAAASNRGQFRWPLRGEACIGAHPEGHSRNVREARRNALLVMRLLLGQVREQDPLLLRIRIGSLGVAGDATQQTIWPGIVCMIGSPDHPFRVRIRTGS